MNEDPTLSPAPAPAPSPGAVPADPARDYARVATAISWIRAEYRRQPSVGEMAAATGLSGSRFTRLFSQWAGVPPAQYLRLVTLAHAKAHLSAGLPVLDAALETGLSSAGRIHDLFVDLEAVTPGDFRRHGEDLVIRHERVATPFGDARIALTHRGVCHWAFLDGPDPRAGIDELRRRWPRARLEPAGGEAERLAEQAFSGTGSKGASSSRSPLRVVVQGTRFQIRVWRALLELPAGSVTHYGALARCLGQPKAARAVGAAVGANPVAWLIPCHRVLRADGSLGGYRWNPARKQVMLDWECLRTTGGA